MNQTRLTGERENERESVMVKGGLEREGGDSQRDRAGETIK